MTRDNKDQSSPGLATSWCRPRMVLFRCSHQPSLAHLCSFGSVADSQKHFLLGIRSGYIGWTSGKRFSLSSLLYVSFCNSLLVGAPPITPNPQLRESAFLCRPRVLLTLSFWSLQTCSCTTEVCLQEPHLLPHLHSWRTPPLSVDLPP